MADLAVKVPQVAEADVALLRTGALLLFSVFAVKAALVPLHWWLPMAYGAAAAPAAALFAVMTKVGAYSILRVYTLIFGGNGGPVADIAEPIVLPAALITLIVGTLGVLASRRLIDLVCYSVVASMGTLLIAAGLFDAISVGAALYYLVHSTFVTASLFLIADLVAERRGHMLDRLVAAPAMQNESLFGGLFLLAALAMVGMPPLSGFIGKLLILDATRTSPQFAVIWGTILVTSLLLTVGFARAGSVIFWKKNAGHAPGPELSGMRAMQVAVVAGLLVIAAGLTIFAGPVMNEMTLTADQLFEPARYVRAVLGSQTAAAGAGE
jgi:multicomponent K+:H+ antiporter subunit D